MVSVMVMVSVSHIYIYIHREGLQLFSAGSEIEGGGGVQMDAT